MGPSVAVAGAATGAAFEAYVERALCPSLSPDPSPIEEAFSKVEGLLRRAEARAREGLIEAMGRALEAVSASGARGFFGHCGYRATGQQF